jgi:large subunit ribosomal protein L35
MPNLLFVFFNAKESINMPKMKTHSGAKKRFKLTATGKVRASQAGKQHFMRRRTKAQLRNQRGTTILCDEDAKRLVKIFLPNGTN